MASDAFDSNNISYIYDKNEIRSFLRLFFFIMKKTSAQKFTPKISFVEFSSRNILY